MPPAFKMIRRDASSTTCAFIFPWSEEDLLGKSVAALVRLDEEIELLTQVVVSDKRVGAWPLSWSCVTVRADAVRSVPTVSVPAGEGHGHHHDATVPE